MSEAVDPTAPPPSAPAGAAGGRPVDGRARLTVGLVALAFLASSLLALGVGRPPRAENAGVVALREEMRTPGRGLFTTHKCIVCHGQEGGGTDMGPGLGAVASEYLAASGGDAAAARDRLVAYLMNPSGVPTLRRDGTRYPNPMPSAAGLGLDDEAQIRELAEFVLRMRPAGTAVGGDASDR